MTELRELYQEVIIDHSRRPRNFHRLDGANREAEGYNPLCGDKVTVYLKLADGLVEAASFEGSGCAISMASASLMTESLKGKTEQEAHALFERIHAALTGRSGEGGEAQGLGKLAVLSGVRDYPARVKCATLAWHTMHVALDNEGHPVSTE
jgi:nitrogen fixation protein NifU and related proteins